MHIKTSLLLLVIVFCSLTRSYSQSYFICISHAESSYGKQEYKSALNWYRKAFRAGVPFRLDLYSAGQTAFLAGDTTQAFKYLNASIDYGFDKIALLDDKDLEPLHTKKQWPALVAKLQKRIAVFNADPVVKQLQEIMTDDQGVRVTLNDSVRKYGFVNESPVIDSLRKIMIFKDSINLSKTIKIIDKRGWLGPADIGSSSQTLFLVIQHSDLATQKKYLSAMRKAAAEGKLHPANLSTLEDRVALREGNKQIYGSQIGENKKTGLYYVQPLLDPDHVNERRAKVGLEPIEEYVKQWNITWNSAEYKKSDPENTLKQKGMH